VTRPAARNFDILPALHLSQGRLVDLAADTSSDEPVLDDDTDQLAAARHAIEHGAQWLHIVNVDTSFDPAAKHDWSLIKQLCQLPVKVQYGGGLARAENIDRAIEAGVSRVLLTTLAITSPEVVAEAIIKHGRERFALAITAGSDGVVVDRDWDAVGGLEALTLAVQMSQLGISTLVHTRLQPDGTMSGTDLDNSCELAELSGMDVIVGGEVRNLQDVVACYNRPGITGVLIGKALQTGKFGLGDALDETRATLAFESGMPRWKEEQQTIRARLRRNLSHAYLLRYTPELDGLRVLDAGGGNGLASLPIAESGANVDVVDRSMAMLHDLKTTAEASGLQDRIRAHEHDIRSIRELFEADTFDLLICHNVIHYNPAWEELLVSMIAPLKTGGLLSLVVRNWNAEPYRIDVDSHTVEELPTLLERTRGPSRVFDADVLFFTATFLQEWLRKQGFEVLGDYGLLCRADEVSNCDGPGSELMLLDKLQALESAMGERAPYKHTARYLQIIARKL
jgi:phosphoribosylformimino-5-aminoimidazole carboxamide ribonucleotide (ProFAR) isomerase/2-polyprenyl-3-methyl-5-hydroxy-6-metoxy-1,4-benzoquinol methylase